jgi:hypothetical protein
MFTSIRTKRVRRVQSNHPSRKHRFGHICVRKALRSSTLPQHIFERAGVASIRGVRIFGGFYSSCAIENVELNFRCDSSDGWVYSQDKQIELTMDDSCRLVLRSPPIFCFVSFPPRALSMVGGCNFVRVFVVSHGHEMEWREKTKIRHAAFRKMVDHSRFNAKPIR